MSLTHELSRERELCQSYQTQVREAQSKLEELKKSQRPDDVASAKSQWRKTERGYKNSIDEVTGQLLRLTAEKEALTDALQKKDAELRTHLRKERGLESQLIAMGERLQKLDHAFKNLRQGVQKNKSSYVALFSKQHLGTPLPVSSKVHLSFSSQSSIEDVERTPQSERCWNLPHRELYGVADVHSLYVNDDESDCSVRCRNSSAEQSADEGESSQ